MGGVCVAGQPVQGGRQAAGWGGGEDEGEASISQFCTIYERIDAKNHNVV